jgi:hypothetical protein
VVVAAVQGLTALKSVALVVQELSSFVIQALLLEAQAAQLLLLVVM